MDIFMEMDILNEEQLYYGSWDNHLMNDYVEYYWYSVKKSGFFYGIIGRLIYVYFYFFYLIKGFICIFRINITFLWILIN